MDKFYVIKVSYKRRDNKLFFAKDRTQGPFESRQEAKTLANLLNSSRSLNREENFFYDVGTDADIMNFERFHLFEDMD